MSIKLYGTSALFLFPLVIVIILGVLLSSSYDFTSDIVNQSTTGQSGNNNTGGPNAFVPNGIISLQPVTLNVPPSGTVTLTVSIDSGGASVSAVQVEIPYDVTKIENVVVIPENYFANQTVIESTTTGGKIVVKLEPASLDILPRGVGTIAAISFSKVTGVTGPYPLSFADTTVVTAIESEGQNILKSKEQTTLTF